MIWPANAPASAASSRETAVKPFETGRSNGARSVKCAWISGGSSATWLVTHVTNGANGGASGGKTGGSSNTCSLIDSSPAQAGPTLLRNHLKEPDRVVEEV